MEKTCRGKRMNRFRGSNELVIVIHEIYGINQHIQEVCESLSGEGFDVICPNLLSRQAFDYSEEEAAYCNFMENVGFANASAEVGKILQDVKGSYEKIYIVGFSVGATAGWLCSEEDGLDGVVGYYGSRIRNYLKVAPACPVMLFFPEHEKSFSLPELIVHLKAKNIDLHQFGGEHGFSDPYSPKHCAVSRIEAYGQLIDFLKKTV